ncbi:MAG: HAD family hydrolase [Alphaproteobacteria bacterium]
MLRLALFDCDGTLVDSQHEITAAMKVCFESHGLVAPDLNDIRQVVGIPLMQAISQLAGMEDGPKLEQMTTDYREAYADLRIRGEDHEPLFEGTVEAMDRLEQAGWLLGVATGKSRGGMVNSLEKHGILNRFITTHTADEPPGKPHPEGIHRACRETGVDEPNCVMIGDTAYDIRMAKAAKVPSIGVTWGYHSADQLEAEGADLIIERFDQLFDAMESLVPLKAD